MSKQAFIHETAIIDWNTVTLGKECFIGPYCVLKNCHIGDNVKLTSHVSIGEDPEITGLGENDEKRWPVLIGSNTVIREFVTVHSGSKKPTFICINVQIFRHAHIAHDCFVGPHSIVSGGAIMCGHSKLLERAQLAAGAILHQFVVVGHGAFIGAGAFVEKHVQPFAKVAARGVQVIGLNLQHMTFFRGSKQTPDEIEHEWKMAIERDDPSGQTTETKIL